MEYGGSGGEFVKFDNVGDGVKGVVESAGSQPNRFRTDPDVVITIREDGTGATKRVRCDKATLKSAANQIMAEGGFRRGERIEVRFKEQYQPKNFSNKGKLITINLPDRGDGAVPPAAPPQVSAGAPEPSAPALTPEVQAAYDTLVSARGAEAAAAILGAVQNLGANDEKKAEMLRKAAGA